jgi:thioredoxin 1
MSVANVSDADFDTVVHNASVPAVVDFWAAWCGPCRSIAPALEVIAKAMEGKIKIVKLNVDENPDTPSRYRLRSIPTLMLFKSSEVVTRHVGGAPLAKLQEWIETAL